ncbi:RND transporter [Campylobacterota bacterium]|nr:RND transporter [Campylobacterota bacterium]
MRKIILTALTLFAFVGCSLTPTYETPQIEMPQADENSAVANEWWRDFGDETLNAVVKEALENNFDLLIAAGNVAQARAALGLAESQQYPIISANGERTRDWVRNPADDSKFIHSDTYALSGVLSYEIDLWSKIGDNKRSVLSKLFAMEETREAIRLSLIAGAIESYYSLLALEYNSRSIDVMLASKEEAYALRQAQADAGALTELTLSKVAANLKGTRSQLVDIARRKDAAQNSLSVLLGRSPKSIIEDRVDLTNLFPKTALPAANLPSDLLLRRPDIRAAEENLKASNYSIGAARAEYLPSFSITGAGGFRSGEFDDLFKSSSQFMRAGLSMNVPLLSFGRIGAQVDAAKAAKEIAIINYRKAVSVAFSEVNDALSRRGQATERLGYLREQVSYLAHALSLTKDQYEAGYLDYTEVIDAETDYLTALMNLNNAEFENIAAQVELYKALGGGTTSEAKEGE